MAIISILFSGLLFVPVLINVVNKGLLTLKRPEIHGYVVSTVATDALVLKHQAISIHNADKTFIVLGKFHIKRSHLCYTTLENNIIFKKNQLFKGSN